MMLFFNVQERRSNLCQADRWLRKAREIAVEHPEWIESRKGWAYPEYDRCLRHAHNFYVAAGLGLVAGRVRWLAQRENVVDAWVKFDKLNAGGCGVA